MRTILPMSMTFSRKKSLRCDFCRGRSTSWRESTIKVRTGQLCTRRQVKMAIVWRCCRFSENLFFRVYNACYTNANGVSYSPDSSLFSVLGTTSHLLVLYKLNTGQASRWTVTGKRITMQGVPSRFPVRPATGRFSTLLVGDGTSHLSVIAIKHTRRTKSNRFAVERTTAYYKVWFWSRHDPSVPHDVKYGSSSVNPRVWVRV